MRKTIAIMLFWLPFIAMAQSNWEVPTTTVTKKPAQSTEYQYARYLGNVVPVVNGEVVWEKTFNNDKNAEENYAAMLSFLTTMTTEEIQLKESNVSLVDKTAHRIACHFEEWMTFRNTALALDRTRFIYTLLADCFDHRVTVRIFRVGYWYEEQRNGGIRYKAEEWITDEWALNKKRTRLAKQSGKFRRFTVDRVEQIFNNISNSLMAH